MTTNKPTNIDEYIAGFPKEVQEILETIRATIQEAAPTVIEAFNYAIPTFVLHGNLVHFAAYKNHIGFYATPAGHTAFAAELSVYKEGKGSVQFPINEPMPLELISKIVKFRVEQNLKRSTEKKSQK